MVSSSGGHIDLLVRSRNAVRGHSLVWITQDSVRARTLQREHEAVHILPNWSRRPRDVGSLATNLARSLRLALRERPRLVITSGSGLAVPFCVFSRALGARLIFIETPARVNSPSQAGRVLSRIASCTLVQWPSMLEVYPSAQLCLPAVLSEVRPSRQGGGEGTYVGVGNHSQPFDRLLSLVDEAVGRGLLPHPVIAQTGVSPYVAKNYAGRAWLEPGEVAEAIAASRYVVAHGGTGSISTALHHGRRPIVLPRLRRHGEHFDDHQEQLVGELARLSLVVRLGDRLTENDLAAADAPLSAKPETPDPVLTTEAALRASVARLL